MVGLSFRMSENALGSALNQAITAKQIKAGIAENNTDL